MPANYKPSQQQIVIEVLASINTTTMIQAFGSGDGYTNPAVEFADDETIAVAGTLQANNNANLTGVNMTISVDGVVRGTTALYGFSGGVNYFQFQVGVLSVGQHTILAAFPRTRK